MSPKIPGVFVAYPHKWTINRKRAAEISAAAAMNLPADNSGTVPGVALFRDGGVFQVFTEAEAVRLATEMLEALDRARSDVKPRSQLV